MVAFEHCYMLGNVLGQCDNGMIFRRAACCLRPVLTCQSSPGRLLVRLPGSLMTLTLTEAGHEQPPTLLTGSQHDGSH